MKPNQAANQPPQPYEFNGAPFNAEIGLNSARMFWRNELPNQSSTISVIKLRAPFEFAFILIYPLGSAIAAFALFPEWFVPAELAAPGLN